MKERASRSEQQFLLAENPFGQETDLRTKVFVAPEDEKVLQTKVYVEADSSAEGDKASPVVMSDSFKQDFLGRFPGCSINPQLLP